MTREIIEAVRTIEREKGIEGDTLITALEDALLAAYKKTPGASRHATVELDDEGDFRVYSIEMPARPRGAAPRGGARACDRGARAARGGDGREEPHAALRRGPRARLVEVPEEQIKREDVTPENFGRIAAQTAKQVILQRIREAEREMMYDEYVDRVSEVVTGIVQQAGDRNNVLVDLGKVEALLPRSEQVDGERYEQGSRIKAVITEVRSGTKGPQVILSRRDPGADQDAVRARGAEIADGLVEIRGVAREPGYRSKIAVESHAQGVDPVGACVGPRGSRVRMVVSELRGEKIDIIPWNTEPARFVAKALSPARVREVYIDDESREATVVVPDDQLALAIGKEGLNARLAARLTGWKIDIQSDTEFAQQEAEAAFGGGERRGGLLAAAAPRSSRTASAARTRRCRARASAASRRTRSSRRADGDDDGRADDEPELEALADDAPEAEKLEDADAAESETRRGRADEHARPDAGSTARASRGGSRSSPRRRPGRVTRRAAPCRVVSRDEPIRTCAGCGRKAPQAELLRFAARDGDARAGAHAARARRYTCRRSPASSGRARAAASTGRSAGPSRVDPALARLYT